ncbi:N-acetyl-gamma-glutamyl-phosphate reductase [Candidatus Omnitrophota bacterium]
MIRVGIIGATGYTGEKLIEILVGHPQVRISYLSGKIDKKENITHLFPKLSGKLSLDCDNYDAAKSKTSADVFFLAVPHTVAMHIAPDLLKAGKIVIDLSADYRFKDAETYKTWYKVAHADKANLKQAVYGLPEFHRQDIKTAKLIANPGCYPTAALLSLAPIVVSGSIDLSSIIIDAKSGLTGAGRKAALDFFFSEVNENLKAYKVNSHQHMPEIEQKISSLAQKTIKVNFIPHLIPMNRGILETIYLKVKKKIDEKDIHQIYKRFYKIEPFVRVVKQGMLPQIKDVIDTNFCDIGVHYSKEKKLLVVVAAIDNLMKGAAGQAVQNMNIILKCKEDTGLL